MSSRNRLVSGSARSANNNRRTQGGSSRAATAATAGGDDESSLELPAYQPPTCPLSADGQRMLRELSAGGANAKQLRKHADESAKLLADAVWVINERLTSRKKAAADAVEREAKRRRATTTDGEETGGDGVTSADIESARARVAELGDEVEPLTMRVEKAMREVLDLQASLQDEKDVLETLPDAVGMAQQDRSQDAENDEDDEPPEVTGVPILAVLDEQRKAKTDAYENLSAYQKYARNNAYIDFKRNWHQGLFPDVDVNVPDPHTWFDRDGNPQHETAAGADEDDEDDDIQIAREKRSYRCPLSLAVLTEPYTCRRCKHSFQKEAIFDYLGITSRAARGLEKKCPETGCQINVSV